MIALGKGLKYEGRKFGFSELYLDLWSLGRFIRHYNSQNSSKQTNSFLKNTKIR